MTFEEFKNKFNIKLTQAQLSAVKAISNPTLLLAVPGSGKTTVLVTRLGYMIYCCGIEPEKILTITYTVAATNDMKKRFASMFGEELADRLEFKTINAICFKIIHYYGSQMGKEAFNLVSDEGIKARLLTTLYVKLQKEYPNDSDIKAISTQITYIKNMMLGKSQIDKLGKDMDLPLYDIYKAYCDAMRENSQMDFDDQMTYAYTMLRKVPGVLSHFQEMYQFICVDEAQDTSKIQHEIIKLLASKYENLFMVGDEDQSIYGFRAAYPEALLNFEKEHPNANVLLMEDNFRSNARIVEAADAFINKNELRHKKNMKPTKAQGEEIKEIPLQYRKAQYTYIAKMAKECRRETAVLYRDNESIIPVIDILERENIDYRIKNADLTFFTSKIVMDIQNIIRFAYDQTNEELFMQIYYKLSTYMNKNAAVEACKICEERNVPVLEAALRYGTMHIASQKSTKAIQTHLQNLLKEKPDKAIYRIVNFMGYREYLDRTNLKDTKTEILEAIGSRCETCLDFLERLEELANIIKEKETVKSNLVFSTIHSSKGLEYDCVYLMDVMDGIFPENPVKDRKKASKEEIEIYEEERRLFYVGVTRAKNLLNLFTFQNGNSFTNDFLQKEEKPFSMPVERAPKPQLKNLKNSYMKERKRIVTEAEYLDKLEEIQTTGYLKHRSFGEGRVISVVGDVILVEFNEKPMRLKLKYMMEQELI